MRRIIPLFFMSLLFLGTALILICVIGTVTTLTCVRNDDDGGRCALASQNLLGTSAQTFPVATLQGASVDERTSDDSGSTYRVKLTTSRGPIMFTGYSSSSFAETQRIADAITAFVQRPTQPSLSVTQDGRLIPYLIGGIFIAAVVVINISAAWQMMRGVR